MHNPLKKYFDVFAFNARKNQFATLFTDVTERKRAEKVQEAVYKISQTSVTAASLTELYGSIHGILAELMPVNNFYIAFYDPIGELLSFPYFVDQYDQPSPPQKPGRGLTEYVLRTGSPLLASPELFAQLVQQGEVELVGTDSVDWLGVPLKAGGRVIGALVTQSYTEGVRFGQEEKDLLEFVSTQVASAIDRKRAEEALRESEERYRILFEESPISLWEEDFSGVKRYLEELQRQGVKDIKTFLENHPEHVTECVKQIKILDVNKATLRLYQAENKADILDHSERILNANNYETIGDELEGILQGKTEFDKEVIDQTLAGDKIMIRLGWTAAPGHEDALSKVIVSKIDITEHKRAEMALQQAKEFAENVIQTANAIFVQLDMVGNVQKLNTAAEEITGYSWEEVEGKNWFDILVPRDRYPYVWEEYIRLTERGEMPEIFENPILTKHGRERQILWKNSVLREEDKIVGTISFGIDITERKLAEEKIQRQLDRLTALSEIDRVIASSVDIGLNLNILLTNIIAQLGVDAADVLLFHSGSQMLEFISGLGFQSNVFKRSHPLNLEESYASRVVLDRASVQVSDLAAQKNNPDLTRVLKNEGFSSYYGLPLISKGQVKGVLEVYHRSPFDPDEEWLDFLNTLAGQAAIAIDNAELFEKLGDSNAELMLAYDETIEGWSQAMDLRDKETEGHTRRVTEFSMRLAGAMGMNEKDMVHIRWGAMLHDIGKMGVPDDILRKPGPLTDEEWGIMRKHPQLAYDMLAPITYLRPAIDIPYCHHEKWDGTGYPRGLKGDQIPLSARVFAIVDVWDALISDRPYRKAWPREKTLDYIREQSGKHFDPNVVKVFLEEMINDKYE